MGIKLSTSEFRAAVSTQFNDQSLAEAAMQFADATEALCAHLEDGSELCHVVDNLTLVTNALANGGLTKQFLATFNSEGETSAAAGCESLTVAGLEALGNEQVAALEAKFTEGITTKAKEYWAKFVQWLKNFWAKLVNWFKSMFVARARYVKAVGEVKSWKPESFNGDVEIDGPAAADLEAVEAQHAKLEQLIETAVKTAKVGGAGMRPPAGFDAIKKAIDEFYSKEYKTQKLSLKFNYQKLVAQAAWYTNAARSVALVNASKYLTTGLDNLTKEAGKAANVAGSAGDSQRQTIKDKYEAYRAALEMVRYENKLVMKIGAALAKIISKGYKAPPAK